jgi:hypothetical protein
MTGWLSNKLSNKLIIGMEYSLSWEAESRWDGQSIPGSLWKQKARDQVHKI